MVSSALLPQTVTWSVPVVRNGLSGTSALTGMESSAIPRLVVDGGKGLAGVRATR